jgi:choline dehydrogenase-like flavoprotein
MPFVNPDKIGEYDVIVVGSGAAGGQTAYTLAMGGARVLMLEAGRNYVPERETPMFQTRGEAPLRAASTPDKPFGFHDATIDGGWQVPGEPYVNTSEDDSSRFDWWRARMLGGRTNHWGRYSFRNGPYDFKPKSRDGLGFDWPLTYEELAPYYDKVEMLIGVYGHNDGLENTPNSSPGCLLPPPKPRVSDLLIAQRSLKLGIPVVAGHRAVLTQKLDDRTIPAKLHPGNVNAQKILAEHMRGRAACFWATPCGRGCSIRATYQSTTVHLPPALATGKLDILVNAMVREVTLDKGGRASGVVYVDKDTGKLRQAKARAVVLGASSCETVRILLNSKSANFPQGLANSSGKLGRYLMDTVGSSVDGQIPLLEDLPPHNEDGASGGHMYAPWWLYQEQLAGKLGFARGYHVEFGGGRSMPGVGTVAGIEWLTGGSYGRKFKEDARRYYGSFVWFDGRGEMIPNEDSYCELDPKVKGQLGDSPCCASIGNGPSTKRAKPRTCSAHSARSSRRWAAGPRNPSSPTARKPSPRAARSSTKSAAPSWAPTRPTRSRTGGARPGMCRTSSSPTARCSPPMRTRTRRSRSWHWPGGLPTISSTA